MDAFSYTDGALHAEDTCVDDLAARFGTPLYVYSRQALTSAWKAYDEAFAEIDHLVCYAVKANSNLSVLQVMAGLGSGFDIVSVGELRRVLKAGGDPRQIVFAGVGKSDEELSEAISANILSINVESRSELRALSSLAGHVAKPVPISLRVNPDVDAKTHPYISTGLSENKFGIPMDEARALYLELGQSSQFEVLGIDIHIGSQLTDIAPYRAAIERALRLVDDLREHGVVIHHLNIGGGIGIQYRDESPPEPTKLAEIVRQPALDRGLKVLMEPGRSVVGNAGVLLTKVRFVKTNGVKQFAVVDAAMNDLIRPALYDAWQEIVPSRMRSNIEQVEYDVVGPICETGDFLGLKRSLAIEEGDLLAVRSSGAYGFVMSSNYNARLRAAEVLVDGEAVHLARARESYDDLIRGESLCDWV